MIKSVIRYLAGRMGFAITRVKDVKDQFFDMEKEFFDIYDQCRAYTMNSPEKLYALFKAVEYVEKNGIEGDIVECGVWRGGCAMVAALSLLRLDSTGRHLYLYDTYEGMSPPTEKDVEFTGKKAEDLLLQSSKYESAESKENNYWCYASIEDVRRNLALTGYPVDMIRYVKGKVETSIPDVLPDSIAILRLDTDWYESTYHEMKHLFPRLSCRGVLILDDYGYWQGSKAAVDAYCREKEISILLNRMDDGRIGVKV